MINGVIVLLTMVIELGVRGKPELATPMCYDRIELLRPGQEAALVADIADRTGLSVVRVQTERIDLLRDAAEITIYFRHSPESSRA